MSDIETTKPSDGAHMPALDGVRGLAILMVLLLHFWPESFALGHLGPAGVAATKLAMGGLWGVELFFVLSGFLITGILLRSRQGPGYFRNFYMRRVLRIFPLYYGTLVILLVLLPAFVALDRPAQAIRQHSFWLWTYLSNFPLTSGEIPSGWDDSRLFWVGHFWSLCVEEHFYMVWPLVVWSVGPNRLARVCVVVVAFSASVRLLNALASVSWGPDVALLHWTTLTKLDGLAVGSLIAVGFNSGATRARALAVSRRVFLPSALIFLAIVLIPRRWDSGFLLVPGETAIVAFFGCVLIRLLVADERSWWRTCFQWGWLRMLGRYSYGLYVLHGVLRPTLMRWIDVDSIHASVRFAPLSLALYLGAVLGLCLGIAVLSYHGYEAPFLRLKRFFPSGGRSGVRIESTTAERTEPAVASRDP